MKKILILMLLFVISYNMTAQSTKFVIKFEDVKKPVKGFEINECLSLLFYGESDFNAITRLKHDDDPLHIYVNICGKGYNLILVPTKDKRDKIVYTFAYQDEVLINIKYHE